MISHFFVFTRFNYTYYDKKHGPIYKSIEALDRMGMEIIETGDADVFKRYLSEFDNTICGRHPISVFLHVRFAACLNSLLSLSSKFSLANLNLPISDVEELFH